MDIFYFYFSNANKIVFYKFVDSIFNINRKQNILKSTPVSYLVILGIENIYKMCLNNAIIRAFKDLNNKKKIYI